MEIQQRILKSVLWGNWILLCLAGLAGLLFAPLDFAKGIVAGGLIVTINFHMLYRTLKKSLTPPHLTSHTVVLVKYYLRFIGSGFIIFLLISGGHVHPLGLFIGLSVVVASIGLATLSEIKKLICKEAV
ncbi:MAG TPA: ATP synthase subunit I [Desulfosalsimonadaceae bacterium]|nr:ATP synthase subunit I [Desulfosalsimonadaceae bacterium]